MSRPSRGNIVLKMPRRISIYYFGGLLVVLLVGLGLLVVPGAKGNINETANTILQSIGASLIAGSIVGAAAFAGTLVTQSLQQDEELLRSVREMGIVGYFNKRYVVDEYEKYSKNAREFDLLGYGLGRFRKEMRDQFGEWASTKTMRILVINPNSSLALQRDREENDRIGKISHEAAEITADLADVVHRKKIKRQAIIKWYNAIPTVNIMRIDDVMYIGPYFVGKTSGSSVTLKLERNTVLFNLFESHFDDIWNKEGLSIDPTFVSTFPGLLRLRRKYSEHKAVFLVGDSCSGKTTALEVAEANQYAVVDWSDVLREFFREEGREFDFRIAGETVRERGIHFFPHRIMNVLLSQYVSLGDSCRGFVVAGARNLRELCYLSTFFDRSLTKIVCLFASEEARRQRYNKREGKTMSRDAFLRFDDSTILWDLETEGIGSEIARTVRRIRNDTMSEGDFKKQMNALFQEP